MKRPLIAAALVAVSGCALEPLFHAQPNPTSGEGAWAEARDHVTRRAALYDGFGTQALVSAVYLSSSVRQARVARLALWSAMTESDKEHALQVEQHEAELYDDFLVALFTPDRTVNDLDRKPSAWNVTLTAKGESEVSAAEITGMRPDATLRSLYPNIGDFDQVYRVRFRRLAPPIDDRDFTFKMAGALGKIELAFGPDSTPAR